MLGLLPGMGMRVGVSGDVLMGELLVVLVGMLEGCSRTRAGA